MTMKILFVLPHKKLLRRHFQVSSHVFGLLYFLAVISLFHTAEAASGSNCGNTKSFSTCSSNSPCAWYNGNSCISACAASIESECTVNSHCSWSTTSSACYMTVRGTTCGWGNNTVCKGLSGCFYDSDLHLCNSSSSTTTTSSPQSTTSSPSSTQTPAPPTGTSGTTTTPSPPTGTTTSTTTPAPPTSSSSSSSTIASSCANTGTDQSTCVSRLSCMWESSCKSSCGSTAETQCTSGASYCSWGYNGASYCYRNTGTGPCLYGNRSACVNSGQCSWDNSVNQCRESTTSSTTTPATTSTPSPPQTVSLCPGYTTASTCVAESCTWLDASSACTPSCQYSTITKCEGDTNCAWNAQFLGCKRKGVNCGWGIAAVCLQYVKGCSFDANSNRCFINATAGCSYSENGVCTTTSGCVWVNGACATGSSSSPSTSTSTSTDQAGCTFATSGACTPVAGCSWDSGNSRCVISYSTTTPCGYAQATACNSVRGCVWDVATAGCKVTTPTTPCGFDESTACRTIGGCAYNQGVCTVVVNASCPYGDSVTCASQPCAWTNGACKQNCPTFTDSQSCQQPSCYWNPDSLSCSTELRCLEMVKSTSCALYSSTCRWNTTSTKCERITQTCDSQTTSTACQSLGTCTWYDTATPPCFVTQTVYSCSIQTTSPNCLARGCAWTASTSTCAQKSAAVQCSSASIESDCYTMSSKCFWNLWTASCVNVGTISSETKSISGIRVTPYVPQPGQSFYVEVYGKDMRGGDEVTFIASTNSSSCPSQQSTVWTSTTTTVSVPTFDTEKQAYRSNTLTLASAGSFSLCVRLSRATTSVVSTGVSLVIQEKAAIITSVTAAPTSPYAKQAFTITFSGAYFKPTNFYAFMLGATADCSAKTGTSWYAINVQNTAGTLATGGSEDGIPVTGTYSVCFDNGNSFSRIGTIQIDKMAPWLDPQTLAEIQNNVTTFVTLRDGTKLQYNVLVQHLTSFCPDDNSTVRVTSVPNQGTITFPNPRHTGPYKTKQVCPYVIKPYNYNSDGMQSVVVRLSRVYVDEGDSLMFFVKTGAIPLMPTCAQLTDSTKCERRGCSWSDGKCASKLPDSSMAYCPVSVDGYELVSNYNYVTFTKAKEANDDIYVRFPFPDGGIIVFCSDSSSSLTGFTLLYTVQETYCPGDCKNNAGDKKGSCTSSFDCSCDPGFSGSDCSVQQTCLGTGTSAPTAVNPTGLIPVSVKSTDTCGYNINPDATRDLSLERMSAFTINIVVTGVTIKNPDNCNNSYLILRDDSSDGSVLHTWCTTTDATPMIRTTSKSAYFLFRPSSKTDVFTFEYKMFTEVCAGDDAACDGKGTCTTKIVDTSSIQSVGYYGTQCTCDDKYGRSRDIGSCDMCGFGYRQDTFPTCLDSTKCYVDSDCGLFGSCNSNGICVCKSGYHGTLCEEYIDPSKEASLFQYQSDMRVRFSFDQKNAANTGTTTVVGDWTELPCQQRGSQYTCETVKRPIGASFHTEATNVPNTTSTTNATTPKRHHNYQHMLQQQNATGFEEIGFYMNRVVADGVYKDLIRITDIRGTDLDFEHTLSVAAWIKVDSSVNGFLFAKTDMAFTSSGTSPLLDRALNDVRDRSLGDGDLQLGKENANVYYAVHIDGAKEIVSIILSHGDGLVKNKDRDQWHTVRHFRNEGILFDGEWHYIVVTLGQTGSRYEAQIFVDGETDSSNTKYVQCIPGMRLTKITPSSKPNVSGATITKVGGAYVVGYKFQGGIDELRIYNRKLTQQTTVDIAGDFSDRLEVNKSFLRGMAYFGIVSLFISFCFPFGRFLRRGGKFTLEKKSRKVEPEVVVVGEKGNPAKDQVGQLSKEDTSSANSNPKPAMGDSVMIVEPMTPNSSSTADVPGTVPEVKKEEDTTQGIRTAIMSSQQAVATAIENTKNTIVEVAKEVSEELQSSSSGPDHKSKVEAAKEMSGAAGNVQTVSVGSATAQTSAQASTTQNKDGMAVVGEQLGKAAELMKEIGSVITSFILRCEIARDIWQVVTLYFSAITFPEQFTSIFGKISSIFAIDFTFAYEIDVQVTFYTGAAVGLIAFGVLMGVVLTEKKKTVPEIIEIHKHVRKLRYEAEVKGESYSPPPKSKQEKLSFASLLVLSTAYLPVTRNAIQIIYCHRSVQCTFDCYNETKYWIAFGLSIALGLSITIFTPIFLSFIVYRKRIEFREYLKSVEVDEEADGDGVHEHNVEAEWRFYVRDDISSYQSLYSGFEFRWSYFYIILMVVKVIMCVPILALSPDSTNQLAAVLTIQCVFTIAIFSTSPFLADVCDYIMQVGQTYVVFSLIISCFYRADPTWEGWGYLLNITALLNLIFQIYHTVIAKLRSLC